jgi:hypothetical protein
MGRKSALTDKQWQATVEKFDLDGLLRDARDMTNNERSVMLMLRLSLACGDLARMIDVPAITGHRFEFGVDCGRIDLLLFHADGSVSIVEAKAENRATTIAAGIGQLCMYAAALPSALHKKQRPTTIRKVLCAHLDPAKCAILIAACEMAGVRFAYLPPFSTFRKMMARVLAGG